LYNSGVRSFIKFMRLRPRRCYGVWFQKPTKYSLAMMFYQPGNHRDEK